MATKTRSQNLYPEAWHDDDGWFKSVHDYNPIIKSLGKVLVQVDDDDYSGDTRVLLCKDGRYGFLNFGWGSCCGCDALQDCCSYEEIDELIDELENGIKWFNTLAEAQAYITNHEERQGSYYYHQEEWEKFRAAVSEVVA